MTESTNRIGVFTSGGDAPGMNAAIRAVVRTASYHEKEVFGIVRGYEGMIDGEIVRLGVRSVANIIQRGGTILKSARCPAFRTKEGRATAYANLKEKGIGSLVAIGGDGTFAGLKVFYEEYGIRSICVPGTIDNDLPGTDYTIGYDTATNTAVEAIDKIRDTAMSHNRLFFVEVMGRDSGQIAINSGLAGGAIAIIIPEDGMTFEQLAAVLEGSSEDKKSNVVVVAEGSKIGGAVELARKFNERSSYFDTKVTVLGHLQRGGAPTYFDRVLASKMGVAAVEGLLAGKTGMMVGIRGGQIVYNDFDTIHQGKRHFDAESLRIAKILSI
jgi:6-phosphofructokinase 1